jgi:hypothetical protein
MPEKRIFVDNVPRCPVSAALDIVSESLAAAVDRTAAVTSPDTVASPKILSDPKVAVPELLTVALHGLPGKVLPLAVRDVALDGVPNTLLESGTDAKGEMLQNAAD